MWVIDGWMLIRGFCGMKAMVDLFCIYWICFDHFAVERYPDMVKSSRHHPKGRVEASIECPESNSNTLVVAMSRVVVSRYVKHSRYWH